MLSYYKEDGGQPKVARRSVKPRSSGSRRADDIQGDGVATFPEVDVFRAAARICSAVFRIDPNTDGPRRNHSIAFSRIILRDAGVIELPDLRVDPDVAVSGHTPNGVAV